MKPNFISVFAICFFVATTLAFAQTPVLDNKTILEHSLFDITVTIPEDYMTIIPGGELLASIKLMNIGSSGRIDVVLDFIIDDPNDAIVVEKHETVAVETQAGFVRTFEIPADAVLGTYTLFAKIVYADGKKAGTSQTFMVAEAVGTTSNSLYASSYLVYGAITAIIALFLFFERKRLLFSVEKFQIKMRVHAIVKNRLG
jgi:hypothetical protein